MTRYEKLLARLHKGEKIIIDGATGSEAERRGVPTIDNAWSGGGNLSHPDIVRDIHEEYIRVGAEIIISNSFATTHHALRDAGLEAQFESSNRRAVELACEARNNTDRPDVLVAGGISYWSFTGNHPDLSTLSKDVSRQATIMKEAGADLLMTEMMVDIDRMSVTLDAAKSSGLPVWAGLTCEPNAHGIMCLRNGEPLLDALACLADADIPLVSIMHTEVAHIDDCLDIIEKHWQGITGVYAHVGRYADGNWHFDFTITPDDYAAHSCRWIERNVQIIGGCCGIMPDHISALSTIG